MVVTRDSSHVDTAGYLENTNCGRDFCSCFAVFQNWITVYWACVMTSLCYFYGCKDNARQTKLPVQTTEVSRRQSLLICVCMLKPAMLSSYLENRNLCHNLCSLSSLLSSYLGKTNGFLVWFISITSFSLCWLVSFPGPRPASRHLQYGEAPYCKKDLTIFLLVRQEERLLNWTRRKI